MHGSVKKRDDVQGDRGAIYMMMIGVIRAGRT
jgi:hypothetical protein